MLIFKQPLNKVDEKSENLQMIQTALIERKNIFLLAFKIAGELFFSISKHYYSCIVKITLDFSN